MLDKVDQHYKTLNRTDEDEEGAIGCRNNFEAI